MNSNSLYRNPLLIWIFGCVIIITAYLPSILGPMMYDDQLNIVQNPPVAIHDLSFASLKRAALSNSSGQLKRILPALSFGVNHYLAGGFDKTYVFKITNLAIHLINSALVFWLCYLLWPKCKISLGAVDAPSPAATSPLLPAAFAALVWALHPLQSSAVVYIVQRMTSMSATFVLLGLAVFLLGRQRFAERRAHGMTLMLIGIIGGTALGLLCKENAALLVLYAGVIEFTLFNRDLLTPMQKRRLSYFYGVLLMLPLCAGFVYMFIYPGNLLDGYAARPFTLEERLLTQSRVLWFYLYLLAVPDITSMGLFHDDFPLSNGWLSPWTTLPSAIAWALVLPCGFLLRKKMPVIAFGIFWYLAGHSMESTFIPLEMVFEHRNYLPSLGPILMLCTLAEGAAKWIESNDAKLPRLNQQLGWLKTGLPWSIIAILYWLSLTQAEYWRSEDSYIASQAVNHPNSSNSQYLYGEVLNKKQDNPAGAYPFYYRAAELRPDEVAFLVSLNMLPSISELSSVQRQQRPELFDLRHIARLLHDGPVSAWGMRALDVAAGCVAVKYEPCVAHADEMLLWLPAIIANPLTSKEMKRHFISLLINTEMAYDHYDDALQTVQQAKIIDPGYLEYDLLHAKVLAAGKRYWEALQILAAAQEKPRKDKEIIFKINQLRSKIISKLNAAPES